MLWLLIVLTLMGMGAPRVARAESNNGVGIVVAVAGPVTVARVAATPQPLQMGDPLYDGDVVEVSKNAFARLWLGGRTTVTVRELSRVQLREEVAAEGIRYTLELVWGKLRASVGRMLMLKGVGVWTRNAVASVRGTDFIVETVQRTALAEPFGTLGDRQVATVPNNREPSSEETVVTVLSGLVEVSSRLSGTGKVERVGASETSRVRGTQDPVQSRLSLDHLKASSQGLIRPRLQPDH